MMESLHPLIVHFPIALLLTSVGLDSAALLLRRPGWHRIALWNLVLGTFGAGGAVLSGLHAEEMAKHSFEIWKLITLHERLGFCTLSLGIVGSVVRLLMRDRLGSLARAVTMFLALAMVTTISWGAFLGGRLVYELGVGGSFGRQAVPQP